MRLIHIHFSLSKGVFKLLSDSLLVIKVSQYFQLKLFSLETIVELIFTDYLVSAEKLSIRYIELSIEFLELNVWPLQGGNHVLQMAPVDL